MIRALGVGVAAAVISTIPSGGERVAFDPALFAGAPFQPECPVVAGQTGAKRRYASNAPLVNIRVTLNGFRVNHETYDTADEGDGKGDEVFFITDAAHITAGGGLDQYMRRESKVFGDSNGWPMRTMAGTRSLDGGLKTGDQFPRTTPQRRRGSFAANEPQGYNTLPMFVWSGVLRQGRDAAVIVPTAWEWDASNVNLSPGATRPYLWSRQAHRWLCGMGGPVERLMNTTLRQPLVTDAGRLGTARERSWGELVFGWGTNGTASRARGVAGE